MISLLLSWSKGNLSPSNDGDIQGNVNSSMSVVNHDDGSTTLARNKTSSYGIRKNIDSNDVLSGNTLPLDEKNSLSTSTKKK